MQAPLRSCKHRAAAWLVLLVSYNASPFCRARLHIEAAQANQASPIRAHRVQRLPYTSRIDQSRNRWSRGLRAEMSHLLKQIAQHNAPGPRAAAVPVEDRSIRVVLGGQQAAPSLGRPRASGGDDAALAHAEAQRMFGAPPPVDAAVAQREAQRLFGGKPPAAPCGRAPPPRQSLHAAPQTEPEDRRFEPLDPSELPAVGVASEDAQTLYETAVVDEPTNRPPRRAASTRPRRYPGESSSEEEEEEDVSDADLSARKYVGVTTAHGHARARIKHAGEELDLGTFETPELAARAYDSKAREFGRPVNFPRAGEKQAVRQRRAPPKKRARATPPPTRADPPEATFSYEQLMFERDAARAERDSLVIERDALRSERDTLRGQLSATTGFKDQLLAALLKQRPASSPPNVTASVAISNNTIEMSPTMSNNQTSNQTKPGKNGVRGAQ